jgi:CRP/FNR family transcriptional regulator, cyclic AMP receptor protein
VVGTAVETSTVLPRRHWKSTTPRSVTAGLPATGFSSKLVPPWRAEAPLPTAVKPELAPLERFTQCLLAFSYCRRKLMYILSCAWWSPGIEPRMPIVSGWSAGLHTSIVAHSSCESSSARSAALGVVARVGAATARAEAGDSAATATAAAKSGLDVSILVTIAPEHIREPRVVVFPGGMGATRSADVVELLGRVPVFSTLEPGDLERIAQVALPRQFEPGQAVFREGDQSDTCYVVREGHARAVRSHGDGRTITLATFGPGDIFGELAMFEDERRSATVEAIEPTSVIGVLGPDMRRLMSEHPQIAARLVIALGRRLREMNERLSRQSFQTVQSRVAVVLSQLVEQEIAAGNGAADVLVTATQADLAQLAGSSRESASRFLAVLERAGVISQGRGRLVVHDPKALEQYVF